MYENKITTRKVHVPLSYILVEQKRHVYKCLRNYEFIILHYHYIMRNSTVKLFLKTGHFILEL